MTEKIERPQVLSHLGAYSNHPLMFEFGEIVDECFATYHSARGGFVKNNESMREHLITRLLYISETTSVSARLTASWALTLPSMSLIRDRYEQTVRFSWLARQPDNKELAKFIDNYYAKANKIFSNLTPAQRTETEKISCDIEEWMTTTLTKEERIKLQRWENLSLIDMAKKRDKLPPVANHLLDAEKLADFYTPIYRQFSSVSHYDAYSANLLGLHKSKSGELVLAPHPWWPNVLASYDALFSLIQCHEALVAFYKQDTNDDLLLLHARWQKAAQELIGIN